MNVTIAGLTWIQYNMKRLIFTCLIYFVFVAEVSAVELNTNFQPAILQPTQSTTLEIEFVNSLGLSATDLSLSNSLPEGVFIADLPNVQSTCGGTVTATNSSDRGTLTITGAAIGPRVSDDAAICMVQVDVFAERLGTFINSIPAGALSATQAGQPVSNDFAASASLLTRANDVDASVQVGDIPGTVIFGGTQVPLIFTLENENEVDLRGAEFTLPFDDDGLRRVYANEIAENTCGGTAEVTAFDPGAFPDSPAAGIGIALRDGTIPAESSCRIVVTASPRRDPTLPRVRRSDTAGFPPGILTTDIGVGNIGGSARLNTRTGLRVVHFIDNRTLLTIDPTTTPSVPYRVSFINENGIPIEGVDFAHDIPPEFRIVSLGASSCGGTLSFVDASSPDQEDRLILTGAEIPAVNSGTASICEIDAVVEPSVFEDVLIRDTIPAGQLGTRNFQYDSDLVVVNFEVSGNGSIPIPTVTVTKFFDRDTFFQGETTELTFEIENNGQVPVQDMTLVDDLEANITPLSGSFLNSARMRVGNAGLIATTCDANISAVPNATVIRLDDLLLSNSSSCSFTVAVQVASDANASGSAGPFGSERSYRNLIDAEDVTFDTAQVQGIELNEEIRALFTVEGAFLLRVQSSAQTVGAGGTFRYTMFVDRNTTEGASTEDLALALNLPTDFTLADDPDVDNSCGGTVTAPPGGTTLSLVGGRMDPPEPSSTSITCRVAVTIRAPDTLGTTAVTFRTENVSARDSGQPEGFNTLRAPLSQGRSITRIPVSISVNKEFLQTTVSAGAPSRVRISFINDETNALNLTGVRLVDSFAGTSLRLADDVDPAFTDVLGGNNGCSGGTFDLVRGEGGSITLRDAVVGAGETCRFEFNVTSFVPQTVENRIEANSVVADQGATNLVAASASLNIERALAISKQFSPETIMVGDTATFTLAIVNATENPLLGNASGPTLVDEFPPGMTIDGSSLSTTCQDVAVSVDRSGGRDRLIINGGTFAGDDVCEVSATVSVDQVNRYVNEIAAGSVQTVGGTTNSFSASATLLALEPPRVTKSFVPNVITAGETTSAEFDVSNPNLGFGRDLTGIGFSDVLTNMRVASIPNIRTFGTCNASNVDAPAGADRIEFSDIDLPSNRECIISVDLTSDVVGVHPNTTTGPTSDQTPTPAEPATPVNLTVSQREPLTLSKEFALELVQVDTPTRLTLTIGNPNPSEVELGATGAPSPGSAIALTDIFPTTPGAMTVSDNPNLSNTCLDTLVTGIGGTSLAGATGIELTGGRAPANSSCEVSLNVQVAAPGNYENITSPLVSEDGETPAASATLEALNFVPIESASEDERFVPFSTEDSFAGSILGPGDRINGLRAIPGLSGPNAVTIRIFAIDPELSVDPTRGVIDVAGGTPVGTYTVSYEICQPDDPSNCAPVRIETVTVSPLVVVATTDFPADDPFIGVLGLNIETFSDEPFANVIGPDDTFGGVQAILEGPFAQTFISDLLIVDELGDETFNLFVDDSNGDISADPFPFEDPRGTYQITYELCEIADPSNCDTATEHVRIEFSPITAGPEAPRVLELVPDVIASAGNVLSPENDTFRGGPVDPSFDGNVFLSTLSRPRGIVLNQATGELIVSPSLAVGTYEVEYEICELKLDFDNCASATETVIIVDDTATVPPEIVATTDFPADDPFIGVVGENVEAFPFAALANVIGPDDTFDGDPAILVGPLAQTFISDFSIVDEAGALTANVFVNASNGDMAANTATDIRGTYRVTYELCEIADPSNCDTATEHVRIEFSPITAGPEAPRVLEGGTDIASAGNVLSAENDTLRAGPVDPSLGGNVLLSGLTLASGLTLDEETGELLVDTSLPADTYEAEYEICEVENNLNCASATETVIIAIEDVVAGPEPERPVAASDSVVDAGSVLSAANDMIGTEAATVGASGNGTLSTVAGANTDPQLILDPSTGALSVAAGSPPGRYTLEYELCSRNRPDNCARAVESVLVTSTPIAAASEADRRVSSSNVDISLNSVLGPGDQLDNELADLDGPNAVTLAEISSDEEIGLDVASGLIVVRANAPAGTYRLTYEICEPAALSNCAQATETVIVALTNIQALAEDVRQLRVSEDDQRAGNVLDPNNDLLNGAPALPDPSGNVQILRLAGPNSDDALTLEETGGIVTGEIIVQGGTLPGLYSIEYQICELDNLTNCATAIEQVLVLVTPIVAGPEDVRTVSTTDADQSVGSVLSEENDRLNDAPAIPGLAGDVILSAVVGANTSPELSLDTETGDLVLAASVPAGTFTLEYEICERINPSNCARAVESVLVRFAPIRAGPEDARELRARDIAQGAGNVLSSLNDTLDGAAAVPGPGGNVVLSFDPTTTSTELSLDPSTGLISVAAGAPAGTFNIAYEICDALNPLNCASAVETVVISTTPIEANGVLFPAIISAVGGTTTSILADDLLDQDVPTIGAGGTVLLTVIAPASDPGVVLNTVTGLIEVAAGTPTGGYGVTYQICEAANVSNCDTATESIRVVSIDAVPEGPFALQTDGGRTTSILASDTVNGTAASLAAVTLAQIDADPGLTLDIATGELALVPGLTVGQYQLTYEICDVFVPENCDQAVEIVVQLPIGEIEATKTVEVIDNGNGIEGPEDTALYEITVENKSNAPVLGIDLVDIATDLSGNRLPLTQEPTFQSADQGSSAGTLLIGETATYTASILLTDAIFTSGGLDNTVTAAGEVDQSAVPTGILDAPVRVSDISDDGIDTDGNTEDDPTTLRLSPPPSDPAGVTIRKTTPLSNVLRGSTVPYSLIVRNLSTTSARLVDVVDLLPTGFLFVEGSGAVDGVSQIPEVSGRRVVFRSVSVPPASEVIVSLSSIITTGVLAGEHVNLGRVLDPVTGNALAPDAQATVIITPEPVFDCGELIGKVYDDLNGDGYQNEGEPGLPNVRLASVDGVLITTDKFGRYSFPCASLPLESGTNFILKLDTRTLPSGYQLTTENPRVIRLTRGKISKMNFGTARVQLVQIDLNQSAFPTDPELDVSQRLVDAIDTMLVRIGRRPSTVRLTFHQTDPQNESELQQARQLLRGIEKYIHDRSPDLGPARIGVEKIYLSHQ